MGTAADRAASMCRLLAHVREAYGIEFGFVLWDGSTVPADLPADALALVIADEGVVAAMVRRPKIDTLVDLWVTARIDLRNGSVADLLARRPKVKSREFRKRLDRWLALRVLARFLLLPARRSLAIAQTRCTVPRRRVAAAKANQQAEHPVSLRPLQRVLRALPRSGDGLLLRLLHRLE